jgi:glycosyltransferase A (GT-A) superfamily protein (DUF2064 family)
MNYKQDTAILLFSRSAEAEARHKNWTREPDLNYSLACQLIRRTKRQLAQAALPVFHIDETKQIGWSFGERLANAYRQLFGEGYQHVICVGNDCQNLQINWKSVVTDLKSGKVVLGPDQRGGIYLLGMSATTAPAGLLEKIPWNTGYVFEELYDRIANTSVLETRWDTNNFEDILTDKVLYQIFKSFRTKSSDKTTNYSFVSKLRMRHKPLRAPPSS